MFEYGAGLTLKNSCSLSLKRTTTPRSIIKWAIMATRVLVLLLLVTSACARECIELTLNDKTLLTDSLLNTTILKVASKNDTSDDSAVINIVELWDRFPKIVVPSNGTSEQCRRDTQLYLDSLERMELWALKSM